MQKAFVQAPGHLLNYIPDALEIEDTDQRACCVALECCSCICANETCSLCMMSLLEPLGTKCYIPVLYKYSYSWPCRFWLCCCCNDHEDAMSNSSSWTW